jgi:hypothetical protein
MTGRHNPGRDLQELQRSLLDKVFGKKQPTASLSIAPQRLPTKAEVEAVDREHAAIKDSRRKALGRRRR